MAHTTLVLTETELRGLARLWTRRMNIHNWKIVVAIAKAGELKRGCHGDVDLTENKTTAYIRVTGPETFDPNQVDPIDMEIALVHELLHVRLAAFCSVERRSHFDICQEAATHDLSKMLVGMRRAEQKRSKHKCCGRTSALLPRTT